MSAGTRFGIYLQSSYAVIFRRFYPIPLLFPDEKRFDLLAFSAVSHFNVATRGGVILAWQSSVRQSQLAEASYKMAY